MPYTSLQFIATTGKRIQPDAPLSQEQVEAVEKLLPAALQRLGQLIADSPDPSVRAQLQQDFVLTLSNGEVELENSMVASSIARAAVFLYGTTEPLQYLPYFQDLLSPPPMPDYMFFTASHGKISVRDYTGAVPTETSLTAYNINYVSTLDETPATLIDDLLDIVAMMCKEAGMPMAVAA